MYGQDQSVQEQKSKTFWQRHKGKLKVGLVLLGVALTAAVALYHADQTSKAIKNAGITSDDTIFPEAVTVVGTLGPVGMDKTISLINLAIRQNLITKTVASTIVVTEIGKALANYWGVSHATYMTTAGFSYVKSSIKEIKKGAMATVNAIKSKFKL